MLFLLFRDTCVCVWWIKEVWVW